MGWWAPWVEHEQVWRSLREVMLPPVVMASIRRIVEPDQEELKLIMQRTGADREEAHVLYHLRRARNAVSDLMSRMEGVDEPHMNAVTQSFRTIENVIALRVLERQHPEGWSPGSGGG